MYQDTLLVDLDLKSPVGLREPLLKILQWIVGEEVHTIWMLY